MNNQKRESNTSLSRNKKILLYITITVVSLIVIMYAILLLLEPRNNETEVQSLETYSDFESADYDYNIFDDPYYQDIISTEFMKVYDEYTNITLGISNINDAYKSGNEVGFLAEYVYSIIEGDAEKYNSFFSSEYYTSNLPKDSFTMQKVYDVLIIKKIPSSAAQDNDYNIYHCALEYKILDNNGTFRKDIKDGYKTQYITITDREGRLLIDSIQ